jgi:hypothetical protein
MRLLVVRSHVAHALAASSRTVASSLINRLWYAATKLSRSASGIASRNASQRSGKRKLVPC